MHGMSTRCADSSSGGLCAGGNGCFASRLIRDKTIAKTLSTSEIWLTAAKQENRQGDQPGWLLPLSILYR